LIFSMICLLSGLTTIGCERGVRAGREERQEPTTYQPRPAPLDQVEPTAILQEAKGELMRVDTKNNTITVRAENGMEQTFKFDSQTTVHGLAKPGATQTGKPPEVRALMGKEGSELTVIWREEAGARMATMINVDDLVSKKRRR
jgi:hypothetical protein